MISKFYRCQQCEAEYDTYSRAEDCERECASRAGPWKFTVRQMLICTTAIAIIIFLMKVDAASKRRAKQRLVPPAWSLRTNSAAATPVREPADD